MKIQIAFTAKQEQQLIQLGLETLTAKLLSSSSPRPVTSESKTGAHKWSPSQRKKFINSMTKRWEEKRAAKAAPKTAKPTNAERRAEYDDYNAKRRQRYRAQHPKKKSAASAVARKAWTPERRRKYAATLAAKGQKLNKLAKTLKRKPATNGRSLHHGHAAAMNGVTMRADGKGPLRQPRKAWTPEHRANFQAAMRKKYGEKQKREPRLPVAEKNAEA
jgi:hypothetical protein